MRNAAATMPTTAAPRSVASLTLPPPGLRVWAWTTPSSPTTGMCGGTMKNRKIVPPMTNSVQTEPIQ